MTLNELTIHDDLMTAIRAHAPHEDADRIEALIDRAVDAAYELGWTECSERFQGAH